MKEKNIESIIKQKSEALQSEVRPKLWGRLEKRMDDHYATAPLRKPNYTWLRIAAGLTIVLGAFFFINKSIPIMPQQTTAGNFYIEELSSPEEDLQVYKKMATFSQQHYQTLLNPKKK